MAQIFKGRVYNSSPYPSAEVNYEYTRDGANMKYHFWGKVYLESSGGWYYNNLRLKLYLNGSDIYTKDCKSSSKGWSIDFDSGWHTVSNKTSGTTPFYFSVKDTQNSGWCNYTSDTYQLTVAPAYTSITNFTVSALSETSVRFNWSAADVVDYVWYSTNNGSSWTGVDVADASSGSFDVGSLAANTGYNFKIRVRRKDSQLTTDSGVYYATTYAYPYLTSVPEFTVGNSLTIGIYNPLGRSCTISVIGDNGVEHNGGTITGTSISGFNNDSWKNTWYSTLPSKTQGTYKARLVCATGNVNQLSSAVKYYLNTSDSGFKPTFTSGEVINVVNTANTAIAGSNKFIKNHNSLSGTIKPMTAQRSATGSYYNVSASGLTTVKKDYSSSNINFVLGNMSANTFNVTAVDSRGFSTTVSKTIDLVDYNNPGVTTAKITRQNGIGTKAILAFTGVYTDWTGLLQTNSIQSIRYKIGASGTWKSLPSDATITSSGGVWTLNTVLNDDFATTSQYDLYLEIKDLLETVVIGAYTISTADAFIWKDLANKRIGINKKPDYTLDVNGDIKGANVRSTSHIYPGGQIRKGSAGGWINDRDKAVVVQTDSGSNGNGYAPVVSQKTKNGNWTIGAYINDRLLFNYTKDSDYPNTNEAKELYLEAPATTQRILTSDDLTTVNTSISNLVTRVSNLENVEWRKVYSTRKSKSMSAWAGTKITDMQNHSGSGSTYLEANASGIKVKKACTVLVYVQGTANFPTADCGIRIFQNNSQMYESYSRGLNSWTFLNCFGILNCNAGDIITLAYMCGVTGTYEYLENTSIIGVVIK